MRSYIICTFLIVTILNIFVCSYCCKLLAIKFFYLLPQVIHSVFGRADEMDFKVGGPWNTEKYFRSPWLADKKNFKILDALERLKQ